MPTDAERRQRLFQLVPEGMPVTRAWLERQDSCFTRHAVDNLLKSGLLQSVAQGVYTRPGSFLSWQSLVTSLQNVFRTDLVPGGMTALELHGFMHYLPLSKQQTIHLYGRDQLPTWLDGALPSATFKRHKPLPHVGATALLTMEYDTRARQLTSVEADGPYAHRWPFNVSSPERAFFELLSEVPDETSFAHADQLLQGLTTLSPRKLEQILRSCRSVKLRRLFYWFAERHRHAWLKKLPAPDALDELGLGTGKRMLAKGGKLDAKYLITVPEEMWTQQTPTTGA